MADRRPARLQAFAIPAYVAAMIAMTSSVAAGQDSEPLIPAQSGLVPLAFEGLDGWADEDHQAALTAFAKGCADKASPPKTRALGIDGTSLFKLCREARALGAAAGKDAARAFFERNFVPHRFGSDSNGYLTGYFEPELEGSREPSGKFGVPLHKRPDDLVKVPAGVSPPGLDAALEYARKTPTGLVEHPDRASIAGGALAGRGLELVYVESPVDAFLVHVQGSARIRLDDGSTIRIGFDGKTGHPYTSIARILIDRGEISREAMTMSALRDWLIDHPQDATDLMAHNRSYIFFREINELDPEYGPVGAAGVQLTPWRSLAVDRKLHTFGTPVWLDATLPVDTESAPESVRRLMIAQDTGSAIVGPARGDVFVGSGEAAGITAGRMRHPALVVVLVPRGNITEDPGDEPR